MDSTADRKEEIEERISELEQQKLTNLNNREEIDLKTIRRSKSAGEEGQTHKQFQGVGDCVTTVRTGGLY